MRWRETKLHAKRSRRFAVCSTRMRGTADDYSDKLDQSGRDAIAGMGFAAFSLAGGCVGGSRSGRNGCIPQAGGAISHRNRDARIDAALSGRDFLLIFAAACEFYGVRK